MNKPVAWIYQHPDTLQPSLKFAEPTTYWATVISTPDIPLYTHPVKEQEEPNWKEMYWWMHELNHKHWSELSELKAHPVKELTDEEIKQIFLEQTGFYFDDNPADDLALMDFARAILRKAQEK